MDLTLVVCTRDRADQLRACLARISEIRSTSAWELVVVDNGSRDHTRAVIESSRGALPVPLQVVGEPVPGLGNARNAGWRAANGHVIAFTDDDCYPAVDYVDAVCENFAEDERLGFLGGRILLFDPADYRITISESTTRESIEAGAFVTAGKIKGANFAFRRQALEDIEGFDPRFGAGALFPCEDVDALARAAAHGWSGAYDPRPVVHHHHGRRTRAEADRLMASYDIGRGAYYAKCILDERLRWMCLRYWLKCLVRQPAGVSRRELRAAYDYLTL